MPRKRYYCDYCEKSFSDNPTNRKNHLSGIQHKTAKQDHYDKFRDPQIIFMENVSKKPCHKFQQDGECKFGKSCKYSHLTTEDIENYNKFILANNIETELKMQSMQSANPEEIVKNWLLKRNENNENDDIPKNCNLKKSFSNVKLPDVFTTFPVLPPSIMPYNLEDMNEHFEEFG